MTEWIDGIFDKNSDLYERAFKPGPEATKTEIGGIMQYLALSPDDRVLDICCGSGRHSVGLRDRGFSVTGVDISPVSLQKAQNCAQARPELVSPTFIQGDIRTLHQTHPNFREFTAGINMFSSFGYYDDDSEQVRVLTGISRVMTNGGRLLLDLPNKEFVLPNFRPKSEFSVGNMHVTLERCFDGPNSRLTTISTIKVGGQEVTIPMSMRLYTLEQMKSLLAGANFSVNDVFADFEGTSFSARRDANRRMVIVAKKTTS